MSRALRSSNRLRQLLTASLDLLQRRPQSRRGRGQRLRLVRVWACVQCGRPIGTHYTARNEFVSCAPVTGASAEGR